MKKLELRIELLEAQVKRSDDYVQRISDKNGLKRIRLQKLYDERTKREQSEPLNG